MPLDKMRDRVMKGVPCIAGAAALAVAAGLTAEIAFAQSRYEFDDQGRPVERYLVHASCNSRALPDAGFRIARRAPGRDKLGPSGDASPPDYARSQGSLPGAMRAARADR